MWLEIRLHMRAVELFKFMSLPDDIVLFRTLSYSHFLPLPRGMDTEVPQLQDAFLQLRRLGQICLFYY